MTKILLIEGNPRDAHEVEDFLPQRSDSPFSVHSVSSQDDIATALAHSSCDLIVMDLSAQTEGTLEELRLIRDITPSIPVIAYFGGCADERLNALPIGSRENGNSGEREETGTFAAFCHSLLKNFQRAERDAAPPSPSRLSDDLLSVLSTKMRGPMGTVSSLVAIMEREVMGPIANERYRSYIHDISQACESIMGLLDGMLDQAWSEKLANADIAHREILDLSPDMICVCKDGIVASMNATGAAMVGAASPDVCVGQAFSGFVHPDYRPVVDGGFDILISEPHRVPIKLLGPSGRNVHVEIAATPMTDRDRSDEVLLVARDVTERQRSTAAVLQREERLRKIMDTMVDGLIMFDEKGIIETFNVAAERIFGYCARDVVGKPISMLIPEAINDYPSLLHWAQSPPSRNHESLGRRQSGERFPVEMSLAEMEGMAQRHFICVLRDITERKRNEERLTFLATRDHLTGLPNRAMFRDRLEQSLADAKESGTSVGVLLLDLDHFKNINDTLGHSVGDRVIQEIAARLKRDAPAQGFVSHMAGDEFTVILQGFATEKTLSEVAQRLLESVSLPIEVDGREIYISASIGIVAYPRGTGSLSNIVKNVDTALHFAKRQGRNTFCFYSEELSHGVLRRSQIENGLRRALKRRELWVAYQPKIDLISHDIIGAEALLRWTSRELGMVSPAEFIPIAEETGLIVPIGAWVLQTVCKQISEWSTFPHRSFRVAVNLSARQFREPGLAQEIMDIISDAGIAAGRLELELTESMLVENANEAIESLQALKDLGITLSIDDFGTGYSSLSYLKRFPIDALKIDQSFVRDITTSADNRSITRAIISMARSLDLELVAEGVETEDQAKFLLDNRCSVVQGYLFSKPLPPTEFKTLLERSILETITGGMARLR